MTARDKLNEAKFFLDMLKQTQEKSMNLKSMRYLTSAFLTAIRSIPDHALYEANIGLRVGFDLTDVFNFKDFKKRVHDDDNSKGIGFAEWYEIEIDNFKNSPFCNQLREITNKGVHSKDIRYSLKLYIKPKNKKEYDKPKILDLEKTGEYPHFDDMGEVFDLANQYISDFTKNINKIREEHGDEKSEGNDIEVRISFPDQPLLKFSEACEVIYKVMEKWTNDFKQKKIDMWY